MGKTHSKDPDVCQTPAPMAALHQSLKGHETVHSECLFDLCLLQEMFPHIKTLAEVTFNSSLKCGSRDSASITTFKTRMRNHVSEPKIQNLMTKIVGLQQRLDYKHMGYHSCRRCSHFRGKRLISLFYVALCSHDLE